MTINKDDSYPGLINKVQPALSNGWTASDNKEWNVKTWNQKILT